MHKLIILPGAFLCIVVPGLRIQVILKSCSLRQTGLATGLSFDTANAVKKNEVADSGPWVGIEEGK